MSHVTYQSCFCSYISAKRFRVLKKFNKEGQLSDDNLTGFLLWKNSMMFYDINLFTRIS